MILKCKETEINCRVNDVKIQFTLWIDAGDKELKRLLRNWIAEKKEKIPLDMAKESFALFIRLESDYKAYTKQEVSRIEKFYTKLN